MVPEDDPLDDARSVGMTAAAAAARVLEVIARAVQEQARQQAQALLAMADEVERRLSATAVVAERSTAAAASPEFLDGASAAEAAGAWQAAQQWRTVDEDRFGGHADVLSANILSRYELDVDAIAALGGSDGVANAADAILRRVTAERERTRDESSDERVSERGDRAASMAQTPVGPEAGVDRPGDVRGADLDASGVVDLGGAERAQDGAEAHERVADDLDAEGAGYDTAARRAQTEAEMATAGVPAEARSAAMVADHLNAQDPATAARSAGRAPAGRGAPAGKAARPKTRVVERGR